MSAPLVLGITGASGAVFSVRLLQVLVQAGRDVHLTISSAGFAVLKQELDVELDSHQIDQETLVDRVTRADKYRQLVPRRASDDERPTGKVIYHDVSDFMAPIASGSFPTDGMVVCPCSSGTLSAIVVGSSGNLIQRAADVHMKEQRKLILVPRETPLSLVQLENMKRAGELGASVLPASPGWYHGVKDTQDLVDFVVSRILDQLDVTNSLISRWGE